MLIEQNAEPIRVNARTTDVFDIFNLRQYVGANPYLNKAALVFDFAFTGYAQPLSIEDYLVVVGDRYSHWQERDYQSHAELFTCTVAEVNKLEMDLHLDGWSIKPQEDYHRVGIESLHQRTTREVIYCVWDWFE
jgi:cyanophycin synthetase